MSKKTKNKLRYFLKDVVDNRGRNPEQYFDNEKYPVIDNFLIENKIYPDLKKVKRYINQKTHDSFLRKYLEKDDVLITLVGNGFCSVSLSPSNKVVIIQNTIGLQTNEKLYNKFLYYYLILQQKNLVKLNRSSSQPSLNQQDLLDYEIEIPENIKDQQKIASVLSTLDAKIELNNKINTELEAMAKTLYDYWFVQFDFPDENSKPYKSSGGEMVWSDELKREIPKGWEVKKVSELIAEDKSGDWGKDEITENYTQEVFCIRGADINGLNGKEQCEPPKRFILEKNDHKLLKPYDLIIEISGGSPTQSTGRIAHISPTTAKRFTSPLICSNFCKALSLEDYKLAYNFHFFWNRLYDNKIFFGYEGKTSGIKNFLFDSFAKTNFMIVPSNKIKDSFFDIMESVEEKRQKILEENKKLDELRDFLLPMLMNGQVVVE